VKELFASSAMSSVVGFELDDGRSIVIKRRPDEHGRAERCVHVQALLAASGFPCPRPLTDVTVIDGIAVHAEEWIPGGTVMREDGEAAARSSAILLADLMTRLAAVEADPPFPNPEWVRWDHSDDGIFPANRRHDARATSIRIPSWLEEAAHRARSRLLSIDLPRVIGHADWEAQNLRWHGDEPHVVHDWDSLAYQSEAAIVGAAAGAFASTEVPTLAPLASSEAFLRAYEDRRGHRLTTDETCAAWAASLWPAFHNARAETLYEQAPVAVNAVHGQLHARLELAQA
jgi:Phosphotransferase enzyme family